MEEPTKRKYAIPSLKEHGIVRELTQSGSGGKHTKRKKKKRKDHKKGDWWRWW